MLSTTVIWWRLYVFHALQTELNVLKSHWWRGISHLVEAVRVPRLVDEAECTHMSLVARHRPSGVAKVQKMTARGTGVAEDEGTRLHESVAEDDGTRHGDVEVQMTEAERTPSTSPDQQEPSGEKHPWLRCRKAAHASVTSRCN